MLAAQQQLHAAVAALASTSEHLRAAWPTELNPQGRKNACSAFAIRSSYHTLCRRISLGTSPGPEADPGRQHQGKQTRPFPRPSHRGSAENESCRSGDKPEDSQLVDEG